MHKHIYPTTRRAKLYLKYLYFIIHIYVLVLCISLYNNNYIWYNINVHSRICSYLEWKHLLMKANCEIYELRHIKVFVYLVYTCVYGLEELRTLCNLQWVCNALHNPNIKMHMQNSSLHPLHRPHHVYAKYCTWHKPKP